MLKKRLNKRVLKYFKRLYKNLWFLVKKKTLRDYKLINSIIYLNIIIRRDVNLLPSIYKRVYKLLYYEFNRLIF